MADILPQTIVQLPAHTHTLLYSAPKPREKRYLKNSTNECKRTDNGTPNVNSDPGTSSGQFNNVNNCKNVAEHTLYTETAYCFIEYTLSGSHSSQTSSNSLDTFREKSVSNSYIINSSPILLREKNMEIACKRMKRIH